MVNLLLNKGASPSTCDKKDRQPLHWAAFLGGCSCFHSHLSSVPHLPGVPHLSDVVTCVPSGHLEVLKLLVARGADVMCKDRRGYTLLHTAAASGQIDVVRHLLRLGVEVRPPGLGQGGQQLDGWWQQL